MNSSITPEIKEILEAVHYRPAVSIIMPFEPKMGLRKELANSLKIAADKVEQKLLKDYPRDIAALVMKKVRTIISNLNFDTHKKSIAIYVSPVFEKLLYLDVLVEERIIIDESFEIRDLVYSKKQVPEYLVLLLSGNESRIYSANPEKFVRIVPATPESVDAYVNEIPERVANFSDPGERKEIMTDKFLHHIDNALDTILNTYGLPLFVMGPAKILGHFKKISKHKNAVIEYIHGNYEEATLPALRDILKPWIADWKIVMQKDLLIQLDKAAGTKKLSTGIEEVWQEAMNHKGRLLVVEKDFIYPAEHGGTPDMIYKVTEPYNKFSYIKDAVDDIIEKVLENGGNVEFVDKDILKDYHRIALIRHY